MDVWSLKQIHEWQVADDVINNILYFKSVSQYPSTSPEVVGKEFPSYLNQWDSLSVKNGVLYRHWYEHDSDCESRVIVAPKQLRRELFHHLHEWRTGGHLGIKRTVYQLQRRFIRQAYKVMLALVPMVCYLCETKTYLQAASWTTPTICSNGSNGKNCN